MGSIEAACVGGFLCRLCSEVHRLVIHVYSDKGLRYGLAKKINAYLPVTISPDDPLPKTICRFCMGRLLNQHEFIVKIHKNQARFKSSRAQQGDTVRTVESSHISNSSTSQEPQITSQSNGSGIDPSASSSITADERAAITSVRKKGARTQV